LSDFLSRQPANTKTTPYNIALNIKEADFAGLPTTLNRWTDKYVSFNLSWSAITNIPNNAFNTGSPSYTGCPALTGITIGNSITGIGSNAFRDCANLTGITIPDSVAIIGEKAFYSCTRLASVTFQGPIHTDNFNPDEPFMGDLRTKFYSVNSFTGTPGTYTTAKPGWEAVWTLTK